ncbi:unnamed protein product [Didymodactylos carnosus]|uniref:G-protein coupled receptors family 1 profile domain-containing protein n=1 Tax=Didymodactylos carnosus TaxID=1234261 RepID=A0A8S2G0E3_9BILA|nr:unnamed protein product [Didymodactylos carnosus]CAF4373909.1 unnamed protein product [Didymodactylos carnosus]
MSNPVTDIRNLTTTSTILGGVNPTDIYLFYATGLFGILTNILTIGWLVFIPSFRIKHSCFLYHHCLIGLIESLLCIPYATSYYTNASKRFKIPCNYMGSLHQTSVTAQVLNIAAMLASEAYRFEELLHDEVTPSTDHHHHHHHHHQHHHHHEETKSTVSCSCLMFGIGVIWCSSIILHLGKI